MSGFVFPLHAAINNVKIVWQRYFCLTTAIGALDCTHVEILKPSHFESEYINQNCYASVNVQAMCDAEEMLTNISVEWPGSVHDLRIWRRISVRNIISRFDGSACLLGDSEFTILPWLITPFKVHRNKAERKFIVIHAGKGFSKDILVNLKEFS